MPLGSEDIAIAKRAATALRSGAATLAAELTGDNVTDCLMRWGIVLAILGADVLEGVVTLLAAGNQRAANMLARAIADYNVRLRYYFVQSLGPRRQLQKSKAKRKRALADIRALRDWNNSGAKHALLLNQHDPSTWTDVGRKAILATLAKGETPVQSRFSKMCKYLERHEARERGVIPILQDGLTWSYKHHLPAWAMQSCFLHGDQVIISDVIDFSDDGEPTGGVHLRAPYDAERVILFSALDHATQLLRSLAFVRPVGWIENEGALRRGVAELFLKGR